ncbi:hypothetical protein [Cellulomonas chengniuliangii]|uniref:Major facilitator superfamily (MFS) profile domain-containing protein n=1 Tax=Cellulomonas chengniuliangii TaxID=2968084 RepID=A0ABY5KWY7_9CELL|nr:hypothetical protein [Cellulomonas chengniuliangii]MCC2308892.1 hypothetical protein [Cellulomonas chengniuliangii]MCC2317121.1 hypothetical protein [Cellulomonas chengniuliangii]UUI74368.1 hypothetical protein NP064_11205 [Cellulomonas chengniuliangii]
MNTTRTPDVVDRERERFGGIKVGSAFFGWLTATGTVVLLTAVIAAIGIAIGSTGDTDIAATTADATADPTTVGIVSGVLLLLVVLVGYYCGGYVAGRMARFNGVRQGVAVWLWAVVVSVVVAVLTAIAGARYNVLAELNGVPTVPVDQGDLTTAGIIALLVVAAVGLLGAVLGGLGGMRFHRRIDRYSFGE